MAQRGIQTKATQARGVESWVKHVLTLELLEKGFSVLELYCGTGVDLGKWQRANIKEYVALEPKEDLLKECQKSWELRHKPFPAVFLSLDPKTLQQQSEEGNTQIPEALQKKFDVVVCYQSLENNVQSEEDLKLIFKFAFSKLRVGGYFFGLMTDSSAVWTRAQRSSTKSEGSYSEPIIQNDLFAVLLHQEKFVPFGTPFSLRVKGEEKSSYTHQYFVHIPSMLRVAKGVGFESISLANCQEFYEDNRTLYMEHLDAYNVFNKKAESGAKRIIENNQNALIGLWNIFIFCKPDEQAEELNKLIHDLQGHMMH